MSDFWKMLTAMSALFAGLAMLIVSLHLATGNRLDRIKDRIDSRFDGIESRLISVERELYELRGELKGRDLLAGS